MLRYHKTGDRPGIHHPAQHAKPVTRSIYRSFLLWGSPVLLVVVVSGHGSWPWMLPDLSNIDRVLWPSPPPRLSNIAHVIWSVAPHDVADTRCGNSPVPSPHLRDTKHRSWHYTFAYSFCGMPDRRLFSGHGRRLYVTYTFDGPEGIPDCFRNVGVSKHFVRPRPFLNAVDSICS